MCLFSLLEKTFFLELKMFQNFCNISILGPCGLNDPRLNLGNVFFGQFRSTPHMMVKEKMLYSYTFVQFLVMNSDF